MIGHHSRLRDMMGQSYPIYACSRANNGELKHATFLNHGRQPEVFCFPI